MSYTVQFEAIKDATNIIFLDDEANHIKVKDFEKDLQSGYRAGMIIIPVASAIQIQVAMMTPYHKEKYTIDENFLIEKFKEFCETTHRKDWIPQHNHDYFLGEVEYS